MLTSRALMVFLLAAAAQAGDAPFVPGKDGWLTLFDGSDVSRWKPSKSADWALKDGTLAGTKGETVNYWQLLDFEMVAACKGEGEIRFRYSTIPDPAQPGYWLDVSDGTLRAEGSRVVAKGTGAKSDAWREVRLVVSKGVFTVSLDGKPRATRPTARSPPATPGARGERPPAPSPSPRRRGRQ